MRRVSDPAYNGNGVGRVTPRGVGDYLILAKDLQYGDVAELRRLLEEVSKRLEAYSRAIVNSDS